MDNKLFIAVIESSIGFYKEHGKSANIANLFIGIEVEEPSILHDFIIELALTMHPDEEVGVGCRSIEQIENALKDYKNNGTTDLLN